MSRLLQFHLLGLSQQMSLFCLMAPNKYPFSGGSLQCCVFCLKHKPLENVERLLKLLSCSFGVLETIEYNMKTRGVLHFTTLTLYSTFLEFCSAEVQIRQQPDNTCPIGGNLCVYFAGASCVNVTAGDTCCIDGSGVCSGGFECGTGVAASRCCEVGSTVEQCAQAVLVGTATTIPAMSTSSSGAKRNNANSNAVLPLHKALTFCLLLFAIRTIAGL
ncbi:hypothetical protein EDD37DRAFT_443291 [Exophiala viscosa]|uniref:uncharacterized protein n=1 Tax=Exophiala viscosa TaxID=2486360 RepID=UPI002196D974|nr:hypothetical protein EDD37DRAFT_443291 [Exophiala viscosa]